MSLASLIANALGSGTTFGAGPTSGGVSPPTLTTTAFGPYAIPSGTEDAYAANYYTPPEPVPEPISPELYQPIGHTVPPPPGPDKYATLRKYLGLGSLGLAAGLASRGGTESIANLLVGLNQGLAYREERRRRQSLENLAYKRESDLEEARKNRLSFAEKALASRQAAATEGQHQKQLALFKKDLKEKIGAALASDAVGPETYGSAWLKLDTGQLIHFADAWRLAGYATDDQGHPMFGKSGQPQKITRTQTFESPAGAKFERPLYGTEEDIANLLAGSKVSEIPAGTRGNVVVGQPTQVGRAERPTAEHVAIVSDPDTHEVRIVGSSGGKLLYNTLVPGTRKSVPTDKTSTPKSTFEDLVYGFLNEALQKKIGSPISSHPTIGRPISPHQTTGVTPPPPRRVKGPVTRQQAIDFLREGHQLVTEENIAAVIANPQLIP